MQGRIQDFKLRGGGGRHEIFWGISCEKSCFYAKKSYIAAVSVIAGGNRRTQRKPMTCRKLLTNYITSSCIEYTSPWVMIGTDCTCSCKSIYHTFMTTMATCSWVWIHLMHIIGATIWWWIIDTKTE